MSFKKIIITILLKTFTINKVVFRLEGLILIYGARFWHESHIIDGVALLKWPVKLFVINKLKTSFSLNSSLSFLNDITFLFLFTLNDTLGFFGLSDDKNLLLFNYC